MVELEIAGEESAAVGGAAPSSATGESSGGDVAHVTLPAVRPVRPSSPYWDAALETAWVPRRPYYPRPRAY